MSPYLPLLGPVLMAIHGREYATMKLLIVDDHQVVREGLSRLLLSSVPDLEVLLAADVTEGTAHAAAHPELDAVFLDLNLRGTSGAAAVREFGARCPMVPVIVLSSSENPGDVRSALAAGALGYVPKSAGVQTLVAALQLVLAGEIYVPPLLLDAAPAVARNELPGLTDRQRDVLRLLAEGQSNKEIARALNIAEKTVKAHAGAIFRFLNVTSRTQAVAAAQRLRLL